MLGRPYSFVNAPGSAPHEFYFVIVAGGPLSPRLAALAPGEPVWLLRSANGFFCVGEVPDADVLWCLATGTGLGPFLSILRTPEPWAKFGRIVLVHAVRHANELAYRDVIGGIAAAHPGAFAHIPMVSREAHPGALGGRIPAAIERRTPRIARRSYRSPRKTRTRCSAAIRRWSTTRSWRSPPAACGGTAGGSRGTSRSKRTGERAPRRPAWTARAPGRSTARWRRDQPLTSISSTSKSSVAFGGMTPPAPRSP